MCCLFVDWIIELSDCDCLTCNGIVGEIRYILGSPSPVLSSVTASLTLISVFTFQNIWFAIENKANREEETRPQKLLQ